MLVATVRDDARAAGRGALALARWAARGARTALVPGRRQAAALFALGVVGASAAGLAFQLRLDGRLPSALDWRSAAAVLARDARPGDAVVLSPWWAERAREILPATLPVLAFPGLAGEDLLGVRRVWLLELPGAPFRRRDAERELLARAGAVEGPQRLGRLELTRFDLRAPALPLAFLPDRLAGAEVALGGAPCAQGPGGRRRCPGPPYVEVAREVREVDALPRPCLYAHPSPEGALTLRFPDVPMGRSLRGHVGIVGEAALGGNAPVRLAVSADGQELGVVEAPPRDPAWRRFELGTAAFAGRSAALTFSVTAADPARRHFCFDAYTLP